MVKSYNEALSWIHGRLRLGIKPGLKRMEWLMAKLDHPEKALKAIHVGGTNGKGSTVTYIRSILNEAGLTVGTFTSPYIEHFNERISLNGMPITNKELVELVRLMEPLAEALEKTPLGSPTEFEVITAMAIYYFARIQPVDIAIFEVGLGGRFDSTNVLQPIISVITTIGMDHMQILGETIEEIANEKAGIIKEHVPLITAAKQKTVRDIFKRKAAEQHAKIWVLGEDWHTREIESLEAGERFSLSSKAAVFEDVEISMLGRHQIDNASLAIMAIQLLQEQGSYVIKEEHVRKGLKHAFWPGRLEIIRQEPYVILDGAHNEQGMKALVETVNRRYSKKSIKVVFAALIDKDASEMLASLETFPGDLYFTQFDFPRAAKAEALLQLTQTKTAKINENWQDLLTALYQNLAKNEVLLVTGSLYFISQCKPFLKNLIHHID
ncbi:bifunctional folylpolyglutamate synthase/dihydrofolate synthase [Bacillus chungangensis]|uniref:tetrahydrofolate synthase n=1 Tax=Bacillus chungangensis TaxID=587633 RepID=A0ABT9WMY7_9BACI|nr:folylpolyglutamate synthase/dihydrofolate synthase family protein [Bacillus chungangensis]MDQ0174332.1 dihydrofolate synthase/folylpolyglutamate synthase [Bacillus chungangensis]